MDGSVFERISGERKSRNYDASFPLPHETVELPSREFLLGWISIAFHSSPVSCEEVHSFGQKMFFARSDAFASTLFSVLLRVADPL